uniref:hypothetical protein n=1 Tax=Ornithinicoccus halotolerans TaxID=1748220 RepID=UPI00389937BF
MFGDERGGGSGRGRGQGDAGGGDTLLLDRPGSDGPGGQGPQRQAGAGQVVVTETGVPVQGPLARARVALAAAAVEAAALPRATSAQLPAELGQAWAARLEADQLAVRVALEAAGRGLHLDEGMSLYDWLT